MVFGVDVVSAVSDPKSMASFLAMLFLCTLADAVLVMQTWAMVLS